MTQVLKQKNLIVLLTSTIFPNWSPVLGKIIVKIQIHGFIWKLAYLEMTIGQKKFEDWTSGKITLHPLITTEIDLTLLQK